MWLEGASGRMARIWWLTIVIAATVAVSLVLPASQRPAAAQSALPPLPAGWPSTLQVGSGDGPGRRRRAAASAPFGFRYQYLAGGVNTGNGWATWNPNGQFVTYYIQDSVQNGITPVFTYYMIYPVGAGSGQVREPTRVATNLQQHRDDDRRTSTTSSCSSSAPARSPTTRRPPRRARHVGLHPAASSGRQRRRPFQSRSPAPACPSWPGCPTTPPAWPRPSSGCATRTRRTSCLATTSASGAPAPTFS